MDYSFLPPLAADKKNTAIRLDLKLYPGFEGVANIQGWDNWAYYSTNDQYALLKSTFVITMKKGATYDFSSTSFFDPFILQLYDPTGKVVAVDTGGGTYGTDYIVNFKAASTGDYYISASWDQGQAAAHRFSSLAIFEDVDTAPWVLPQIGTAGIDAYAISGKKAAYSIKIDGPSVTVSQNGQDDRKYVNVERFAFDDGWLATDIAGNAGKAYRLYKAAFDRTPDASGLGFWIKQLDSGASIQAVAQEFVGSKEFGTLYGAQISQKDFIAAVYQNVLDRPLDQAGADFWLTALNNGSSRAQVLIGFSESPENQKAVVGAIQNGIQYEFWW